jgi:ribosomal protein S18 acetylase RimI-like enzyme
MGFREAVPADLDALVALEAVCYPGDAACDRAEVRRWLRGNAINLVWEEGGIVGYVGARWHRGWARGEVFAVSVHPAFRGRGTAQRLLAEAESRLAAVGMSRVVLQVNAGNAGAIRLYEAAGYRLVRRLPDYYTSYADKDALLYEKRPISPSTSGFTPSQSGSHTGTSKR